MDIFHVIIDTSILRRTYFKTGEFERLLKRAKQGVLKLYIPEIVLEERRTQLLFEYNKLVADARAAIERMQRSHMTMLLEGLPAPECMFPSAEDVDRNSHAVFQQYLAENRVEVIPFSYEHAARALQRYMRRVSPFAYVEDRSGERKHIPDSWILEAAIDIKGRPGRHCVLVDDGRFEDALKLVGFEVYKDIEKLDMAVADATAVVPIVVAENRDGGEPPEALPMDKLREDVFKGMNVIVMGVNEALGNPGKDQLFASLEAAGVDRAIAEHEAKTLVFSGLLTDMGSHLIPTDAGVARRAAAEKVVTDLLMKMI
ncbi:PIN domain-containing protein [Cupriavidus pauculus]|uniref:PIN domain-containing protein n=1 Tax=Cupriavidus pauculus TaxID=82633 RepID=UPI001EE25B45|nr:PIN domain-containing protein [Cupriavidus pauculus]GJG96824.1 DUF4935 domain-containing protein [Cupriavidus pauculus]